MPAPSLKRIAHRSCVKYIRNLTDIGQVPLELVLPIINKIDNPDQLRKLEENSPEVVGHTKEAWLNLLKRDIPRYEERLPGNDWQETIFNVQNGDRWHKVYKKLKKEVERETQEQNEELAQIIKGADAKEAIKISSGGSRTIGIGKNRKGWAEAKYDLNKDMYRSGPGSGKASSGGSFFEKLNRNAVTKSSARMRTPTHKLTPVFNKEVKKAPIGLVETLKEKQEIQEQQMQIRAEKERREREGGIQIRAPRVGRDGRSAPPLHRPGPARVNVAQPYDLIKDREARLRNLKTAGTQPNPTNVKQPSRREIARLTEDFLEDDDNDGDGNDDLFGDSKPRSRADVRVLSPLKRQASPLKQTRRGETPPILKRARPPAALFTGRK